MNIIISFTKEEIGVLREIISKEVSIRKTAASLAEDVLSSDELKRFCDKTRFIGSIHHKLRQLERGSI